MQPDITSARRPAAALLRQYLTVTPADRVDASAAAFYAGLDAVGAVAPDIAASIAQELADSAKVPVLRGYLGKWKMEVGVFFDGVDAGGLDDSWRQQPGTLCYCTGLRKPALSEALSSADRSASPEMALKVYQRWTGLPSDATSDDLLRQIRGAWPDLVI